MTKTIHESNAVHISGGMFLQVEILKEGKTYTVILNELYFPNGEMAKRYDYQTRKKIENTYYGLFYQQVDFLIFEYRLMCRYGEIDTKSSMTLTPTFVSATFKNEAHASYFAKRLYHLILNLSVSAQEQVCPA